MGQSLPFSEADSYFAEHSLSSGCLVDTNFLIAISDKDHNFHDDAKFLFEKLEQYQVPIYATVTTRSEFIDYHRRVIVTEALMDMLAPSGKWKISAFVRDVLRSQKGWIDNQARIDNDPYLSDSRIKKCKQAFLPKTQSGQIGWVELCKEYLVGKLQVAWDEIADSLSFYDLVFGTILSTKSKVALVPDNIFRNHIKKLKIQ